MNIFRITILHILQPYYKNYNKRLVKSPKLYFYDSAIVCRLLGIKSAEQLEIHPSRGVIFEGFIISEIMKNIKNLGKNQNILYYWRTHAGQEVDLMIEGEPVKLIEIKSGCTFQKFFVDSLLEWQLMSPDDNMAFVIYAGTENFTFKNIEVLPWSECKRMVDP